MLPGSLCAPPDNQHALFSFGDGIVKLLNVDAGTIMCTFEHLEMWSSLALMPDGRRIVGVSDPDVNGNALIREHGFDPHLTRSPAL